MRVIAIDGPAGSGKSTVARAVARRLDLAHLDTGAMYRSVALAVLRHDVDPADADAVARLASEVEIEVGPDKVTVDGEDATAAIRSPEVNGVVSAVSAHQVVRAELVRRQREWVGRHGGGVVEGRDIGSVVFPHAELKVYLTASDQERARRRALEAGDADADAVGADLARRDELDSTRGASPLLVADDAFVLDTTGLSVDDVVNQIVGRL